MSTRLAVAISTLLLAAATTAADDPIHVDPPAWKSAGARHASEENMARLDHLRRAIEHLQAAGLKDLALQIEEHAEREVLRSELSIKKTELENITRDIRRLERLLDGESESQRPDKGRQIAIRIKLLEIDTTKLAALGLQLGDEGLCGILFDEASKEENPHQGSFPRRKLVDASVIKLLDQLRVSKMAKLIAEPTLITTSGRPVSFFSGSEVPVVTTDGDEYAINYREVGTRIELLAHSLPNGKIRLEVRPTLSQVVQASATDKSDEGTTSVDSRKFHVTADVEPGRTLAFGGVTTSDRPGTTEPRGLLKRTIPKTQSAGRRELIVLITPEMVKLTRGLENSQQTRENDLAPRALQLYPNALEATKADDTP